MERSNMDLETLMSIVHLPDLKNCKRVLFVGPHPDDIEIGAGSTVKKLVEQGTEVHFLIATDGGSGSRNPEMSAGELTAIRKREAEEAAAFLGVKSVEVLSFPDGGVYDLEDLLTAVVRKIIDICPDTVFGPDPLLPSETHPDHLKTAEAVRRAIPVSQYPISASRRGITGKTDFPRNINLIYYFTHRPNLFLPITESQFSAQMEAIRYHNSQIDESFIGIQMYLDFKARTYGEKAKSEFGAGFYAMSPIHQHCFLENIS